MCDVMNYYFNTTHFPDLAFEEKICGVDRWCQAKAINQLPRWSRTEGSPHVKPPKSQQLATRGALRSRPPPRVTISEADNNISTGHVIQFEHNHVIPCTPYRLPRLLDRDAEESPKPKEYVFIEARPSAHFLLHKDPARATPVPECTSPDLRFKPNSTKCRSIHHSLQAGVFRTWQKETSKTQSKLPKLGGRVLPLVRLTSASAPQNPPPSEADYGLLPSIRSKDSEASCGQVTSRRLNVHYNLPPATTVGGASCDESGFERRLTWQLSPYANNNFDRQGLGPNQGPFSREMPVKCMPPTNWLKMKLRHRVAAAAK